MTLYDFTPTTIDGKPQSLADFRGKVLLIVNVASRCGFTPQYAGLEALYQKFRDKGLVILGFPCDQFGHQEPGSEADIKQFCSLNYGVTFPMFAKIEVNGKKADPLYQYLKEARPGLLWTRSIKWNFTKFLVDRRGNVARRFGSMSKPAGIEKYVAALL